MDELLRDPQSGRMFSRLETMAKKAALANEGYGMPQSSRNLLALQSRVNDDSSAVKNYVEQLVSLIREFQGSAAELRKVIPLLTEVATLAKKDKTLSEAEQKRIDGVAHELTQFIYTKTSVFTRSTNALKNISRRAMRGARDKIVESGVDSESALIRMGARLLERREGRESAEKDILKTRADVLAGLVDRKQSQSAQAKPKGTRKYPSQPSGDAFEFGDDGALTPKRVKGKAKEKAEFGGDVTAILTNILDTEQESRDTLKTIAGQLKRDSEDTEQQQEAQERRDERAGRLSPKRVDKDVKPSTKEDAGWFSGLLNMLGFGKLKGVLDGFLKVFGSAGLTGLIVETLIPALTALATGAAIVGAAFAGWKFGEWLDNKLGNKMSDVVGRASAWMTGTLKEYDDMRAAQKQQERDKLNAGTAWGDADRKRRADEAAGVQARQVESQNRNKPLVNGTTASAFKTSPVTLPSTQTGTGSTRRGDIELPPDPKSASRSPLQSRNVVAPLTGILGRQGLSPTRVASDAIPAKDLAMSDAGIAALKTREGARLTPYWDVNGWAIGYGDHAYQGKPLGSDKANKPNVRITEAEADEMLRKRLRDHFEPIIRRNLGSRAIAQNEFDALVSVAYNSERAGGNLARRMSRGDVLKKEDFLASGTVNGARSPALQDRRADEFARFASPTMAASTSTSRAAGPVRALSSATRQGTSAPVVMAPTTVVAGGGGSGGGILVPVPIQTDNRESTFRAVQGINGI